MRVVESEGIFKAESEICELRSRMQQLEKTLKEVLESTWLAWELDA